MKPFSLLACVLGLAALTACNPYGRRVPGNILEKLPYEARIELLEAENDLAIAIDRVDESHADMLRMRDQLRRGRDRLKAAEREVGAADDANSKAVAELAVTEAEARVEWLRARQRLNVRDQDLSALALRCAQARFEQARLLASRKAKLEGSESYDPKDFEEQVKACDAEHTEQKNEAKELVKEAETARTQWEQTRTTLAKKTFDARASPFVE
jgi:hypothetical protein